MKDRRILALSPKIRDNLKQDVMQACLDVLLRSLDPYHADDGAVRVRPACLGGQSLRMRPILALLAADLEELALLTGLKRDACSKCTVPGNCLHMAQVFPPRTTSVMQAKWIDCVERMSSLLDNTVCGEERAAIEAEIKDIAAEFQISNAQRVPAIVDQGQDLFRIAAPFDKVR